MAYFHRRIYVEKPGRLTSMVDVKCGKSQSCMTINRSMTRIKEARKARDNSVEKGRINNRGEGKRKKKESTN